MSAELKPCDTVSSFRPLLAGLVVRCAFALVIGLTANSGFSARSPVFDPKVSPADRPRLEREVRIILDAAPEDLPAFVPERNGLIFCGCPHCDAGTQDGQMTWRGMTDPGKVECKFCQTVYPNERYPENQTRTVLSPRGQPVEYRYFQDKEGGRYFFSAAADYHRKVWVSRATLSLAKLAQLTQDPAHVRRTVILLDAFAEKYPGWCVMSDRAFTGEGPLDSYPAKPRPYYGGIWSRWFYYCVPVDLLLAYDLVRDSGEWQRLAAEKGVDVRARLESDVFRPAVDFVRGYEEYMSNRSPYLYHGLVVAGRVVGEPEWVHDALGRFDRFVRSQFFFDGMWREGSASYHRATLYDLIRVMEAATGYSDPPDYRHSNAGKRFKDFDPATEFPIIRKAVHATNALTFPNGRLVPVHDTWAIETRGTPDSAAGPTRVARRPGTDIEGEIKPPETTLLNAMEHCVLHRGAGETQMQARLHFTTGNGHKHQDLLSLILWANGRELLSDIGYTHTAYRTWSRATAAHNTVVVNETEQTTRGDRCELTLFGVAPGLVQTVAATGPNAYPGITSDYQRQLLQVDVSPQQAYVIDIFQVTGGDRHDWFLHGSADDDQSVTTSVALAPMAGTLLGDGASFRLPTHERDDGDAGTRNVAYAFFRNLASGSTAETWDATFRFKAVSPVQLRTTVLGQPGTTIVTGESPSIRRALENDAKLDSFVRPVVLARRTGRNLSSTFIAVHEPFRDHPFVRSVRRLDTADPARPIALEVVLDGRRDILVLSRGGTEEVVVNTSGLPSIRFKGRTGFLRLEGNRPVAACLFDGAYLNCGDLKLTSPALPAGRVAGVVRSNPRFAFRVGEKVPASAAGGIVIVTLPDQTTHGYRIRAVESDPHGSLVVLDDDPGFALRDDGKIDFLYFPQRKMSGECRYRIVTTARWDSQPATRNETGSGR
jgi:hypothetical protein